MNFSNGVNVEPYGNLPDGRPVNLFLLKNRNGLTARLCEYGAILVSMEVPDRDGRFQDITHGYDTLEGWLTNSAYLGATVGRFGNRIRDGRFTLDGVEYQLARNNAPGGIPCALHGGVQGFDKVLWNGKAIGGNKVRFTYQSKDGEEGYPGNLDVKVTYTLNDENELTWEAEATTDAPTVVNLLHHSYWNLSGEPTRSIADHVLTLESDAYLRTDAGLIPTGEIAPVEGTPMDFRNPSAIGDRIDEDFEALNLGDGYDHAWVLRGNGNLALAAKVSHPASGRAMEVLTNQPAIQLYAGNSLDGSTHGKNGVNYARRTALCLETEGFPDAPNQPAFPSAVLRPGEKYHHVMIHRFFID
jgi:aldose 1-epimerase